MKEKGFEKKVREFLKLQQDKYSIHILPKLEHTSIKLPDILFTIRGVLVAFELKVKKITQSELTYKDSIYHRCKVRAVLQG